MELQQRIEEKGFEISFNPPLMEAVSIGLQRFNWDLSHRILHNFIFDYLESHQFDISYFTNV